jgi:outer membrane autotransporter protein
MLSVGSAALLPATPAWAAGSWTGATSGDWFTSGNWSPTTVPTAVDNLTIDTLATNPTIINAGNAFANAIWFSLSDGATSALTISNNSTLTSYHGQLSNGVGSNATVTVTGAGSAWNSSGSITVGEHSDATLSILNGGVVSTLYGGFIGYASNGNGIVSIDGAGSTWTDSSVMYVGFGSLGTLTVTNGGAVATTDGVIGHQNGVLGKGTVTVEDAGSTWTSSGKLTIAERADGTLDIASGGVVSNTVGMVGQWEGVSGTVTVDGAGSKWINTASLTVGDYGTGALNVSAGGFVTNGDANLGVRAGSSGTASVDGAGSKWTTAGNLVVGYYGSATLDITNGGVVSDVIGYLGFLGGSSGHATIDGAGSTWTNSSSVSVGYSGTGTLNITNGGAVVDVTGNIGHQAGGVGFATIDGAGSTWANSGDMRVGFFGTGTLDIANGGAVSNVDGYVGYQVGAIGTANVDGAGSKWTNSGNLSIGEFGSGALHITSGGVVSDVNGYIASSGISSSVTVDGAGSTWTNSGGLEVLDNGELVISNGGAVTSAFGSVGNSTGLTGDVTIDGAGSNWTIANGLTVGVAGIGAIDVTNAGLLSDADATLGYYIGSTGTVTVDGVGSAWNNSGDVKIGDSGTGILHISSGGSVSNAKAFVASQAGSSGTVTIDGAGSTWTSTGSSYIAVGGTGTLAIANGGTSTSTLSTVAGFDAGSIGTMTVDGTGSSLNASSDIVLGVSGTGSLTVSNGAAATATGDILLGNQTGGIGTLSIGSASGSAATGAGAIIATSVSFGPGSGTLDFNHTDSVYSFATPITGLGAINQIAGGTYLAGNSSGFTGTTNVTGGALHVNGSLGGIVDVTGGMLGGIGTVGAVAIGSGGTLAPGNSIGTLNVASAVISAGSVYAVEVESGGTSDLLNASGAVTINGGAVSVIAFPDYAFGTTYTIVTAAGGVSGTFTTAAFQGTAFITPTLTYDANNVYLDLAQATFVDVALTPNQKAAASGAESLGVGNPLYDAIAAIGTTGEAQAAFDEISGEMHASMQSVLIDDSRFAREAVNDRLMARMTEAGAGDAASPDAGLDLWVHGFGSWGHFDSDGNAAAADRDIGGVFFGGDADIGDTARLGLMAGYSRSSLTVDDRRSSASVDSYHLGLYGGNEWGNLAFRAGAVYAWHDISTRRAVNFTGFSDSLNADYSAQTAQVFGEFGYGIDLGQTALGAARIEPFANLAYVNLSTDDFTETGGAAALTSGGGSSSASFTTFGLRGSSKMAIEDGVALAVNGMIGWRHAFGDTTPDLSLSFPGGSAVAVGGVPIARDALAIEAGLGVEFGASATVGLLYSGRIGDGTSDHAVKGQIGVRF